MPPGEPTPTRRRAPSWARASVALLLAAFATQGFLSLRGKSTTTDEPAHLAYGRQILEEGTFHRLTPQFNSKIPASALNAVPAILDDRLSLELPASRLLLLERLPTLALGVLLGWLVACWAGEAYGPRAAVAAAALYAFSPNLLAHARLVTTDVVTALGAFAAIYALWRWRRAPGRRRWIVAGLALGFALTTKASNLLLVPIVLILAAESVLRGDAVRGRAAAANVKRRLRSTLGAVVGMALVALVVVNAVYGFEDSFTPLDGYELTSPAMTRVAGAPGLDRLPLPLPYGWVQGIDMVAKSASRDRWTYCLGEYRKRGFPYYFLVGLLTKTTVGFLLLLLLAAGWKLGVERGRADGASFFLLTPAVVYFVYLSFFFHFHIGLRYALPILPFLFVFVSQLAAKKALRAPLTLAVGVLLLLHAASSLRVYPHYLAYFNEPSGGPLNGWRYLIDSNLDWGQDHGRARVEYLRGSEVPVLWRPRRPTAGRIMVNVNALVGLRPGKSKRYAWLRENFTPVDHVGYTQLVYDVSEEQLRRCCSPAQRRSDAGRNGAR